MLFDCFFFFQFIIEEVKYGADIMSKTLAIILLLNIILGILCILFNITTLYRSLVFYLFKYYSSKSNKDDINPEKHTPKKGGKQP